MAHPALNIGGVIEDVIGRQPQMRAQNRRADLSDEFFGSDRFLEALGEIAPDAVGCGGRMHCFVVQGRRISVSVVKGGERRHADNVAAGNVAGEIARQDARDLEPGEPLLMRSDWKTRLVAWLGVKAFRQAFDLVCIEGDVRFQRSERLFGSRRHRRLALCVGRCRR